MLAVLALGYNLLWVDLDAALLVDPFKYLPWLYEYVGVSCTSSITGSSIAACYSGLRVGTCTSQA